VDTLEGTVLVTGGAGYIGSHTVRNLRAAGREVVVLDTLELGRRDAVIDAPLVVGDIRDNDLVTATCNEHGVTQVVHFAAYKSVGESMENPAKYWRTNVGGTVELVEACLAADVSEIVFSSSCSVIGTPSVVPATESAPIRPESVYAESKATVEKILSWYGRTNDVRSVSLRYFNAAGASFDGRIGEDWAYSQNLVPLAMKALLLKDRRLSVFGDDYPTPDGTCIRDYIHVRDLAEAHALAVMWAEQPGFHAINLGTGHGNSVQEIVAAARRVTGLSVDPPVQPRRPGDPARLVAANDRARELLGWVPRRSDVDSLLADAWAWHRDHPAGYPA
jgi:UDP-glucose 4-epimerase